MDKLTPGLLDELFDIFGWSRGKSQDGEKKGNQGKRLIGYAMDDSSELFYSEWYCAALGNRVWWIRSKPPQEGGHI